MFRYFKHNLLLAITALAVCTLARMCSPITALIEQQMIDYITEGNLAGFQKMLLWGGCTVLSSAFLYFLNALTQKKFQVRFEESLRNDLYTGIMNQRNALFSEKDTSEQMSFVKTHASTIANNFTQPVFILISYGLMGLVVLGIMLQHSPLLTGISFLCSLLSTIPPLCFNSKLGHQLMEKFNKDAALTFQLKESLNGHETITAFGIPLHFRHRFTAASRSLADSDYKMQVTLSLLENAAQIIQKFTWFFSFLLAGSMAGRGEITVGTMAMFVSLSGEFNVCVTLFAQTIPILLSTRSDVHKMLAIIDYEELEFTGIKSPTCNTKIDICDLSFRYTEEVPLIEHLNLCIHKNEKVALIGTSGCGKSTLVKLMSGIYPSYTGTIYYDNTELRNLDTKKLRKLVTVIHQNTFIFNESIRFNICLGDSFSDEQLLHALNLSGVDRFLGNIPGGLDGACGENGALLSGGQKQRIALARALIRGINILILDEGVSAIDVDTANEIEQELLDNKNLTLLTITHRIKDGLTDKYDRVLLMKDGKLMERNEKEHNV